jgi:hypothetical protein
MATAMIMILRLYEAVLFRTIRQFVISLDARIIIRIQQINSWYSDRLRESK